MQKKEKKKKSGAIWQMKAVSAISLVELIRSVQLTWNMMAFTCC